MPKDEQQEDQGYPKPSATLTKILVGAQLHHQKLSKDLKQMMELCEAKIEGLKDQDPIDVEEITKTQRIRDVMQLEMDKRRYGDLEAK